jgi:hypothetical protein
MECSHCLKTFTTIYSLEYHKKTTKKCLALQRGEKITNDCEYCLKLFGSKRNLINHYKICETKNKIDNKNDFEEKLEKLESEFRNHKEEMEYELLRTKERLQEQLQIKKEQYEYELRLKNKQINELKERLENYEQIKELKEHLENYEQIKELIERLENYEKTTEIKHKTINNDIQEYKFGPNLMVPIRNDGMINATALCKAGNKKINDFLRLQQIKDYLKVLESNTGIPVLELVKVEIGGNHSGTWVHRKVGYHLAQWISPEFAVKVSDILDELFITGSVVLGKEKSMNEIEMMYQTQIKELQEQIDKNATDYQKLLVKHNSTLKTHRYVKFRESGPCFYIIEQGIPCECKYNVSRKKFGVAGLSKVENEEEKDSIDERLKSHRTNWPQLKINYIIFIKEAEIIEQSIKRIYANEINPNGHEIIEGVSTETLIVSIAKIIDSLGIVDYKVLSPDKIKEYNDYVVTTIKVKE